LRGKRKSDIARLDPIRSSLKKDINIEEVMTNLEIDIEKSDSYELIILRNKIISIIRNTLNKLSEKPFSEDSEYNLFYKMINNNDTILTYNWDLLLDNVLGREIVAVSYTHLTLPTILLV